MSIKLAKRGQATGARASLSPDRIGSSPGGSKECVERGGQKDTKTLRHPRRSNKELPTGLQRQQLGCHDTHLHRHLGRGPSSQSIAPACAPIGGRALIWGLGILFVEKEVRYTYLSKDIPQCCLGPQDREDLGVRLPLSKLICNRELMPRIPSLGPKHRTRGAGCHCQPASLDLHPRESPKLFRCSHRTHVHQCSKSSMTTATDCFSFHWPTLILSQYMPSKKESSVNLRN